MRFQEGYQSCKQGCFAGTAAQFVRLDSGHVSEPPRPSFVGKGRSQCGQRDCVRVICPLGQHGLDSELLWNWGNGLARILIVEDNALNIKLFCDLLAAHGHRPEAVTDSRQALDAARAFEPDLVITDIQLPHVSGLELIRQLRADEKLSEVPVMAVTAYSAAGDEDRIRAAGAQAYVSKPISVVKFVQQVNALLNIEGMETAVGAHA